MVAIHLSEEYRERIATLAHATGRSEQALVTEAIDRYIEEESRLLQAVEEGIQSAETEPLTTHGEVVADLLRRGLVTEESLAAAHERFAGA